MVTLAVIEKQARKLTEQERANLAVRMLDSLPALFSEPDLGLAEAERRDAELSANPALGLTLEELDQRIENRRVG